MSTIDQQQTSQRQQGVPEQKQHVNAYSVAVISFITLSSSAYGYAGAIIATTLTQPSFVKQMRLDTRPNAEAIIGAMNALYYAGGFFGSLISGWVCHKYGRKRSVALGNVLILVSGALLTASMEPGMFIAFRFVSGIGSMINLASVPQWIAELSQPRVRGILSDIHAVFKMVGYTLACYIGLAFYFVHGVNQWRGAMACQMLFPGIILCGIYWMPESPRYLLSRDRAEDARKIINRMHANPKDPVSGSEFAELEFYQIRKQMELDNTFTTSWWDIAAQPSMRKRALITIFLEFSLMSSGILVILNYGSIIWKSLGFSTVQVLHFQCGFQLTGFVFNVIAMAFVDKIKRPHIAAIGLLSTAAVMLVLTVLQKYYLNAKSENRGGLMVCVVMIFLFQVAYSLFLDGVGYFYIAEIWPSHVRSKGFAIAMATLSLTNLMWLQIAPHALATIGWRFYIVFICLPVFGAAVVLLFFEDTLHKPLEEIAAIFGDADMVAVYAQELDGIDVKKLETDDLPKQESARVETVENV